MQPAAATEAPAVESLMLDVNETAALTKFSTRTVDRYSKSGLMPAGRKFGNLVRWSRAEIVKWVADGCPRVSSK